MDINKVNKQHGFTIIEVALVLAIAGLIFLVVFLALPALQNSQKDMARRQDVGRVVSALQAYKADNNGDLTSLASFNGTLYYAMFSKYFGKLSQADRVRVWISANSNAPNWLKDPNNGGNNSVGVILGYTCANLGVSGAGTDSTSDAAVWYLLTNGTNYCVNI